MAAPVFQSIQTSTSTTVTKPTSLAVGDLMIAVGFNEGFNNGATTITLPSGFTTLTSTSERVSNFVGLHAGYKIADSSDVAASNFSFTNTAFATISRITGGGVNIAKTANNGGAATNLTFSGVTPNDYSDSVLLMQFWLSNAAAARTFSTYAIATSNPSWTEAYDSTISGGYSSAMAYGTRPEVTATGNFSCTLSAGCVGHAGLLLAIPIPLETTTTETVTATETSTNTINMITMETVTSTETVTADDSIQWSNTSKNSSTWTNTSKS